MGGTRFGVNLPGIHPFEIIATVITLQHLMFVMITALPSVVGFRYGQAVMINPWNGITT